MKTPFLGLLLWFLAAAALFAGEVRSFEGAEQDATGKVWALNRNNRKEPLAIFEKGDWQAVPLPESVVPGEAEPLCIVKLRDGAVAILWRISPTEAVVTRHLGGESRQIARGALPLPEGKRVERLFADSQDRLWITDLAPALYRVEGDGTIRLIHTLNPEEVFLAYKGGSRSSHKEFNPLRVLEDRRGRFWLWSDLARGYSNRLSLKGVLIVEGETVRLQKLGGLESLVGMIDAGPPGIWAAGRKEGLRKIDPDTFETTPIPPPEPDAFRFVSQLLLQGDEPMVVAAPGVDAKVSLWHLKNGRWHDWLARAENKEGLQRRYRDELSLLPVKNGLIVYGRRESPRFLREGKPPVALDWKSGFPLGGAPYAFNLPDGSLLIGSYHGKPVLPPKVNPSPRVALAESRDVFFDPQEDAWWSTSVGENRLHHWSRGKVTESPFPEGFRDPGRAYLVESDGGRRLWLLPSSLEGTVALFDTRKKDWTTYPGLCAAWQAFPGEEPRFPKQDRPSGIPNYSADGRRIAFYVDSAIHYFDGETWRKFTRADIGLPNTGVPFFDAEDQLCILYYPNVYRRAESGKWVKIGPSIRPENRQHPEPDFPERKEFEPGTWPREDSRGGYWFAGRGQLYRLRPGLPPAPVFEKGENQPFLTGRRPREIRIHREGWAFLKDDEGTVILAPKPPLPGCEIEITHKDRSSARVVFKSKIGVHFDWRLDGGEWQLANEKSIALQGLSGGRHVVEAVARDRALQTQTKPSVKEFEVDLPVPPLVRVPPFTPETAAEPGGGPAAVSEAAPEQIAAWIAALEDADYDKRSAAVAALARHRAAALPALRAALEKEEDSDKRWWLKAAIGQAASPRTP